MAYTLLERLAVTFYMISFMSGIWAWFLIPFCFWSPLMVPYSVYLWYSWFGPGKSAPTDVKWPQPFKRLAVWRYAASFYPAKIIKTAELDPEGNYIFAAHPHGIFCSSLFLAFATEGMNFSKIFPGIDVHFLTLVGHFKLPLVRDYILLHGMLDCSRDTCKRVLTGGTGRSIALAVGGALESLHVTPGTIDIIVKRRQGFVRLAAETGASIVPVISFGENDLFTAKIVPPESAFGKFQKWGLKNIGITSPKFSWAGPHQVPINMVFGAPLKVPKFAGDIFSLEGKKLVTEYHAQYLTALQKLYDDSKNEYDAGRTREMRFIG